MSDVFEPCDILKEKDKTTLIGIGIGFVLGMIAGTILCLLT